MPVERKPPMYGMKHRMNDRTATGRARGMPSTTMIEPLARRAHARDGGRADHVATHDAEGPRAGAVERGPMVLGRLLHDARPEAPTIAQEGDREQQPQDRSPRRRWRWRRRPRRCLDADWTSWTTACTREPRASRSPTSSTERAPATMPAPTVPALLAERDDREREQQDARRGCADDGGDDRDACDPSRGAPAPMTSGSRVAVTTRATTMGVTTSGISTAAATTSRDERRGPRGCASSIARTGRASRARCPATAAADRAGRR